ncbi:hypothetical protein [Endozoicomonas sp. ONNA2]|uniref:hypothetical protein n=1 Tax=Endozoicomonas sp. ONNA2 TaxID=2828741 RepID=UPI0021494A55|nr:hypothetical protein [Endozoicomonas sp. ONNA2]
MAFLYNKLCIDCMISIAEPGFIDEGIEIIPRLNRWAGIPVSHGFLFHRSLPGEQWGRPSLVIT